MEVCETGSGTGFIMLLNSLLSARLRYSDTSQTHELTQNDELTSGVVRGVFQQRFDVEKHFLLLRVLVEGSLPELAVRIPEFELPQEGEIYSFHDEERRALAETAAVQVGVVHHSGDCPVVAGKQRSNRLPELVV